MHDGINMDGNTRVYTIGNYKMRELCENTEQSEQECDTRLKMHVPRHVMHRELFPTLK